MKGNKLYSTKEMKPAAVEDAADVMSSYTKPKAIIESKRGKYLVKTLEGSLIQKFLNEEDAKAFVEKL